MTPASRQVKLDAAAPLSAIASALQVMREAEATLRECAEQARSAGHTWQEIGDVLGISRQAAFQRFGRPVDVRTGSPLEAIVVIDAAERAVALVVDLMAGRWAAVRRDFDETMADSVDETKLVDVCAQLAATVGSFEGVGTPFARQLGEFTAVDVPLRFEAGESTARVSFRRNGQVAGLWILPTDGT